MMSDWFEAGAAVETGHGDRFPPLGDGEAQRWWLGGEALRGRDNLLCQLCSRSTRDCWELDPLHSRGSSPQVAEAVIEECMVKCSLPNDLPLIASDKLAARALRPGMG